MKHTFVGDLHGKWEVAEQALQNDGHIVFVGDYLDSFNRSIDDQEKTLVTVLNAVDSGKATALYGNHELSYLVDKHFCSGYKSDTQRMLIPHKQRMFDLLSLWLVINDEWWITHAGIHPKVWKALNQSLDKVNLTDTTSAAHWIGYSRGGRHPVGGIWWCDFNEEFEPIPGMNQIFGHSSYKGYDIRIKDNTNFCIDCLDKTTKFLTLNL